MREMCDDLSLDAVEDAWAIINPRPQLAAAIGRCEDKQQIGSFNYLQRKATRWVLV